MPATLPKRILHIAENHPEAIAQYSKDPRRCFSTHRVPDLH